MAALLLGKGPGTHFIGGWVSPREGLDGTENLSPTGTLTVQPLAKLRNGGSPPRAGNVSYVKKQVQSTTVLLKM